MEALPPKALEGLKRQDGKVTYYLLADLAREGLCYEADPAFRPDAHQDKYGIPKGPIPEEPFWMLLDQRRITTWSGYKEDTGTTEYVWRTWIFTNEDAFIAVLQAYYAYLARPDRDRNYDEVLIGFDCSGRIQPKTTVNLVSKPRT
jgi:hypothetical protein